MGLFDRFTGDDRAVSPVIGEIEPRKRLLRDVVDKMELGSGLIVMSGWKRCEKPMQPEDGCIGDHRVAELGELRRDSVRNRDLLERVREEVAQEITKFRRESVVEETMKIPQLSPWA